MPQARKKKHVRNPAEQAAFGDVPFSLRNVQNGSYKSPSSGPMLRQLKKAHEWGQVEQDGDYTGEAYRVELMYDLDLVVELQTDKPHVGLWKVSIERNYEAVYELVLTQCKGAEAARNKAVKAAAAYFDKQVAMLLKIGVTKGTVR